MKVALTGITGHVGAAVLQELKSRKYDVRALMRNTNVQKNNSIDFVTGDLLDKDSLYPLMKDCEALIHCAAVISINGDPHGIVHRTNTVGTRNILEVARESGVRRVIHISSIHVFEQSPMDEVLDETRRLVEQGFPYDMSKRAGQEIAIAMNGDGMEVLVMNPTAVIGPYDFKPSRAGRMLLGLLKGKRSFLIEGGYDFCDCRDVAYAVVNGITQGNAGDCYLLSGKWYPLEEIASTLSNVSGKDMRVHMFPTALARIGVPFVKLYSWLANKEPLYTTEAIAAVLHGNRYVSSEKATRELDYRARPLRETLADTYAWFQKSGYLV